MINVARSLSARTEFCLVVLVAFGYMMLGSVLSVFYPATEPTLTNEGLQSLVVFELVVLSSLAALLYVRGWRVSRVGPSLALSDIGVAVGLAIIAQISSIVVTFAAGLFGPTAAASSVPLSFVSTDLRVANVLAVSVVNPVFEEAILCGYVVTVLREHRGLWTAVNVSLAIRLTTHLYQGAIGVIGIVPLGFAFTYWYARTGRLWPVILAHALFDVVGLWPYLA